MNYTDLFYAVIAGCAFGIWPNIAANTKMSSGWLVLIVGLCLSSVGAIKLFIGPRENLAIPPLHFVGIIVLSGFINGIGYWVYGPLVLSSQKSGTTFFLALAVAISVIVVYGYGVLILKEPASAKNIIGCIIVVLGLFLVRMK